MNSDNLFEIINGIASTSRTNTKLDMLRSNDDNLSLKKVLQYTYDPFRRYGIRSLPAPRRVDGTGQFDDATFGLLDDLAASRLTGHNARDAVRGEIERLSVLSGDLLGRIILKDMGAGFAETQINKVWKGLIPTAPYMRCALQKDSKIEEWVEEGVYSQIKEDGMFVNVNRQTDVTLTSRAGQIINTEGLDALIETCYYMFPEGTQTHGELIVYDAYGKALARQTGNGLINSVNQGGTLPVGHEIRLVVWDQIPLECAVAKGRCETPYGVRFGNLMLGYTNFLEQFDFQLGVACPVQVVETRACRSMAEVIEHYLDALERGLEGTVVKRMTMVWKDTGSGANNEQVKMKVECTVELKVVGFLAGKKTGKNADTFGSLLCQSSCSELEVAVSGIEDLWRKKLNEMGEALLEQVIAVTFNSIMKPKKRDSKYSLFLPRFEECRFDKTQADSLERIQQQYADVINNLRAVGHTTETVRRIRRTRGVQSIARQSNA